MDNESSKDQRLDIIKEFISRSHSRLAERVEAYTSMNNTDITLVVVEALDTFFREQKNK